MKLEFLSHYFGVSKGNHRAEGDTTALYRVLEAALARTQQAWTVEKFLLHAASGVEFKGIKKHQIPIAAIQQYFVTNSWPISE